MLDLKLLNIKMFFAGDKSWWKFLEPNLKHPTTFQFTQFGSKVLLSILSVLQSVKLAPRGIVKVSEMLMTGAAGLTGAGQEGIFTVGYYILARKP